MDTAAQHTDMAEDYIKRWEPHEGSPTDDVIDALVEVFQGPEMRKGAKWADGRPVFPAKRENTVPTGRAAGRGMCTQQNEVQP